MLNKEYLERKLAKLEKEKKDWSKKPLFSRNILVL